MQEQHKKVYVFDVDGTLMNINHRRHHVSGPEKDWNAFMDEMVNDTPNQWVFDLAHQCASNGTLLIVSGRNERHREITEKQLSELDYAKLFLRPDDDYEPDHIFKRTILAMMQRFNLHPTFVVDDRPSVIKMWRSEGVNCLDVGGWVE
jgi:phosphoglycolate phosphatase-like HAD superfamily hydrolase